MKNLLKGVTWDKLKKKARKEAITKAAYESTREQGKYFEQDLKCTDVDCVRNHDYKGRHTPHLKQEKEREGVWTLTDSEFKAELAKEREKIIEEIKMLGIEANCDNCGDKVGKYTIDNILSELKKK